MRKRLNPDSAVFRTLELLTNLVLLNLLFIICSMPLVTAGAAACALYDAMFRYLKNEDSTVLKPFFRAFCNNFRQGTIVGIPLILAIALLYLIGCFCWSMQKGYWYFCGCQRFSGYFSLPLSRHIILRWQHDTA